MKQLILDTLIFIFNRDKIIKVQKKKIKSLSELNALNTKELMKVYNIVMQSENCKSFNSIFLKDGKFITDDFFRQYMIDKIYKQSEAINVVYCPELEEEMCMHEDFKEEPDYRIITVYNHNMFEHGIFSNNH